MSEGSLPFPRILMGPGPMSVAPRVLQAMGSAPLGHLDPELFPALDEIQTILRSVFGTENELTIALTGTGMAGMEACFTNLVEPGENVIIAVHGFFGERMVDLAGRYGANVIRVDSEWGKPSDPTRIEEAAASVGSVKLIACVHAETSTGVRQPLEPIAEIARMHDALLLVDAVTSLGGLPVEIDRVGIDACYSGTQKCMGSPAGLSPLTVSNRGREAAAARISRVPSFYYDWSELTKYWGSQRAYHHTVPASNLLAFRESLRIIAEEGLEKRFDRHKAMSDRLIARLREIGVEPFAQEEYRLPTLNTVRIPHGVDDAAVRNQLMIEYGIEIGGGLGPLKGRIWRIGTMGESAQPRYVDLLAAALKKVLGR